MTRRAARAARRCSRSASAFPTLEMITVLGVSNTVLGLLVGLVLGVSAAFGGFAAFLIVLVLGAIGLLVGRFLDGQLDASSFEGLTGRGRSTSSRL